MISKTAEYRSRLFLFERDSNSKLITDISVINDIASRLANRSGKHFENLPLRLKRWSVFVLREPHADQRQRLVSAVFGAEGNQK